MIGTHTVQVLGALSKLGTGEGGSGSGAGTAESALRLLDAETPFLQAAGASRLATIIAWSPAAASSAVSSGAVLRLQELLLSTHHRSAQHVHYSSASMNLSSFAICTYGFDMIACKAVEAPAFASQALCIPCVCKSCRFLQRPSRNASGGSCCCPRWRRGSKK